MNDQVPSAGDEIPPDARLLGRLAEAAEGVRGPDVWLVASPDPEARVYGFGSAEEAEARRHSLTGYGVYGPFRTEERLTPSPRVTHVEIHLEDGDTIDLNVGGYDGVDALFFSTAALDKFVYPYYANHMPPFALARLQERLERSRFWLHDVLTNIDRY